MTFMVEILNSWVYGLPTEKNFYPFFKTKTFIFGPSTLEKGTTKLSLSRSVGRYARRVIINLLKKDS